MTTSAGACEVPAAYFAPTRAHQVSDELICACMQSYTSCVSGTPSRLNANRCSRGSSSGADNRLRPSYKALAHESSRQRRVEQSDAYRYQNSQEPIKRSVQHNLHALHVRVKG